MIRRTLALVLLTVLIWNSSFEPLCALEIGESAASHGEISSEVGIPFTVSPLNIAPENLGNLSRQIPDSENLAPPLEIQSVPDLIRADNNQIQIQDAISDVLKTNKTALPFLSNEINTHSVLDNDAFSQSRKGNATEEKIAKSISLSMSETQAAPNFDGTGPSTQKNQLTPQTPTSASSSSNLGYWKENPNKIEPLNNINQIQFEDPLIAEAVLEAGRFYEEARNNAPKGRLGGRKELFTQRDLMRAWVLSFNYDYARLKTLASPKLALFLAFYRAVEFSYGAGLDYDPANPDQGDRGAYKRFFSNSLRRLATTLSLNGDSSITNTPGQFVESVVKKESKISAEELLEMAEKAPRANKGTAPETFEGALGDSGAILRTIDQMDQNLVTQVKVGGNMEKIQSLWRLLDHLKRAIQLRLPALLVGPTGTAKSTTVKWLAAANGVRHLSVAMRPSVGKEEMVGAIRPTSKGLAWQWGFLIKTVLNGDWLTMEEFNLAPSEVLEFLNEFLNSGFARLTQYLDEETLAAILPSNLYEHLKTQGFILKPHPKFRIFLTMNPDFYSARNKLAQTLMNRLVQIWAPDYSPMEMEKILSARYNLNAARSVSLVENLYKGLKTKIDSGQLGRGHKDKYEVNFRTLLRISKGYEDNMTLYLNTHDNQNPDKKTEMLLWGRSIWDVLGVMMRSNADRDDLWTLMDLAFGFKSHGISREDLESHVRSIRFDLRTRKVIFDDALLPLAFDLKPGGSFVPPQNFDLPPTPQVLNEIYWLARRLSSGDHVLLVGETAAGKTSFVQYSHRLLNAALHYTNLSSESADEEVGGGYQPDPKNPGKFRFSQGLLEKAGNEYGGKGTSLFIDEFNLSSLVEWFNTAQDDRILITPEGPVTLGPDTVLIGAMNPPKYQGRNMLSPAIRGRYYEAWIPEADQNEAALRLGWTLKKIMDKDQKSAEGSSSK